MTTRRDVLKIGSGAAVSTLFANGVVAATGTRKGRHTISLDGMWDVAESVEAADRPAMYDRRAPVPGLTNSAVPPFPDVDRFDSIERELIKPWGGLASDKQVIEARGISRQKRNYFWIALISPRRIGIMPAH